MWLAVDCGNSRVKWAAVQNGQPQKVRAIQIAPRRESFSLLQTAAANASEAWVSHVGAAMTKKELRDILRGCKKIRFIKTAVANGGIVNRYRPPSSLGVDRWLSLVAARKLRTDLAVIGVGTAATIDFLRADGTFVGGAVLPGLRLSQEATAKRTNLQFAMREKLQLSLPPRTTNDALAAGAVASVAGAALLLRRKILPGAKFVVGGGDAKLLLPWLPKTTVHLPHPPICGLIRLYDFCQTRSRSRAGE